MSKPATSTVIFGVSDNGLSISYPTDGYADYLFSNAKSGTGDGVELYKANGCDMLDVYDKTKQAADYSRRYSAPSLVLYQGITRRFGHAATDRQRAYLPDDEIERMADTDVVGAAVVQAVEVYNLLTYSEARDRFDAIGSMVREAFDIAVEEPKITCRKQMLDRVSQPMVQVPKLQQDLLQSNEGLHFAPNLGQKKEMMRKQMTRVIAEVMEQNQRVVYIGEDVRHGGYYLVTDGLAKRFPGRVVDFPPDETTLLGKSIHNLCLLLRYAKVFAQPATSKVLLRGFPRLVWCPSSRSRTLNIWTAGPTCSMR